MRNLLVTTRPPSLLPLLDKNISGIEDNLRGFSPLHASSLTNQNKLFCSREAYIARLEGLKEKPMHINTALRVAFDVGEAVHRLIPERWLGKFARGFWDCSTCRHRYVGQNPVQCKVCSGNKIVYKEMRLHCEETNVSGSIDLFFSDAEDHVHDTVWYAAEIKSIDKDEFSTLKAPHGEHRLRTILYLYLIKTGAAQHHSLLINSDVAKIIYVSKGYGKKGSTGKITPFKEFDVEYDSKVISPYLRKAKEAYGSYAPNKLCPTSFVPRVKQCCCPKQCWSGEYDG